ncbi:transposase [Teichococcus wenyumeiae]|nr:transposase [Pseudoroseomonas wenyumeiae]
MPPESPRQKLTIEEKAIIRDGGTPEGWSRAKRAQKDRDARWTLKRGRTKPRPEGTQRQAILIAVPAFGYKSHIGIDRRHGLIRSWAVTDAAQHDSRSFAGLLDPENTTSRVGADTVYRTKRNLEVLERRGLSKRTRCYSRLVPTTPVPAADKHDTRHSSASLTAQE